MKRLAIILLLILIINNFNFSQNGDNQVYLKVDSNPEFVYSGCDNTKDCIELFVNTYKKWPPIDDSVVATIIIQCVVEKNGKLTNFKIKRGLEAHFEKASIDVLKIMPLWKPGKIKGKKVRTQITIKVKWDSLATY